MVDQIGPLHPGADPVRTGRVHQQGADGDKSRVNEETNFKDYLKKSINEVNQLQKQADEAIQDLATGKRDDYAGVITAVEKADVAFQTLMKVRGKLIDAYQEFNRMNV